MTPVSMTLSDLAKYSTTLTSRGIFATVELLESWLNKRSTCTALFRKRYKYGHSYNGRRIGTRMLSIERCYFQWPWVTPNLDLKVTIFWTSNNSKMVQGGAIVTTAEASQPIIYPLDSHYIHLYSPERQQQQVKKSTKHTTTLSGLSINRLGSCIWGCKILSDGKFLGENLRALPSFYSGGHFGPHKKSLSPCHYRHYGKTRYERRHIKSEKIRGVQNCYTCTRLRLLCRERITLPNSRSW